MLARLLAGLHNSPFCWMVSVKRVYLLRLAVLSASVILSRSPQTTLETKSMPRQSRQS